MASLTLKQLTVRYGDTTAVNGIDLQLDDGEFVVFLGPSGCGKTTTLRCIAGLEKPSSGEILFGDQRVNELSASARNVAMVFQFVSLYPHKTVRQNIAFPLKARGVPAAEIARKIDWVNQVFSLGDMLGRLPGSLPPGARQLAALARAVVRDPRVLLLDEPLSAIDEQFREEMRWELRHLQKQLGVTTIHVTHDQREAMSLADRIVLMRAGEIVQVGTPQQLFNHPVDEFAAQFIGSPSMNLVDAQLSPGLLDVGGRHIRLPAGFEPPASPGPVRVGIRAHHIRRGGQAGEAGCVQVPIVDQYAVGRDRHFKLMLGSQALIGIETAEAGTPRIASEAVVQLPCEHLLFFPATAQTSAPRRQPA